MGLGLSPGKILMKQTAADEGPDVQWECGFATIAAHEADLAARAASRAFEAVRHEMGGTRSVTAEEYRDQTAKIAADWTITDMRYSLVAEDDKVVAIGSWKVNGQQMDWVQAFRVEHGKLVETWLAGIATASNWDDAVYANLDTSIVPG